MRSRTADWYETKIRYEKTMEDGAQKKVTEQYVVDALSFTADENTIIEEMSSYLSLIHISEPTRLRRISYAVFCLKKKKKNSITRYAAVTKET